MSPISVISHGPEDSARIASLLAGRLIEGDVVLLEGGLAAGKTTFVKGVVAALGADEPVTSPTFSLAQFYSSCAGPVLHVDAYRLDGVDEFRDLGLEEYFESSITLVEWGEEVVSEFSCHLLVQFLPGDAGPDSRQLVFASSCERWLDSLPGLQNDISYVGT